MRLPRSAASAAVGFVAGISMVVACDKGPSTTSAQTGGSLTCTVPPVTVNVPDVTCSVPPVTVSPITVQPISCSVQPLSCTVAGTARSAVAGTWSVHLDFSGGGACNGKLHLHGTDASLTGAWTCRGNAVGYFSEGSVSGDLAAGVLRLNVAPFPGGNFPYALLIDASMAPDGTSATGTADALNWAGPIAVTLTAL